MSDLMDLTPQIDTITTYLKDPRLVEKKDEEGNSYWEPSQEPLEHDGHPMWVERLLPHTEDYKKAQFSRSAKYINQAQGEGTTQDFDLYGAYKDQIGVMAETTVGWQIYMGGEWVEFSVEKAKEVYARADFIQQQLKEAEDNAEVFTKG